VGVAARWAAVRRTTGPVQVQALPEVRLYQKPRLERFGSFRDLPRIGNDNDGDGGVFSGWIAAVTNGCDGFGFSELQGTCVSTSSR
jgi:hypothetical protein